MIPCGSVGIRRDLSGRRSLALTFGRHECHGLLNTHPMDVPEVRILVGRGTLLASIAEVRNKYEVHFLCAIHQGSSSAISSHISNI
jgi:hypothetical protein